MALLIKNQKQQRADQPVLQQWIQATRPALLLPATTTEQLFRVFGGRVLIHMFVGEVTVVLDATDPVVKISSQKLSNAAATVGTAVDIASTANLASLEVGGNVNVLGSGAALIKTNAGGAISTLGRIPWIAPQGQIYLTTGGTNLTGFMKWDCWYQPLDAGAYVAPVPVAVAKI